MCLGQARIRVQLSASHSSDEVDRAVDAFIDVGKKLQVIQWLYTQHTFYSYPFSGYVSNNKLLLFLLMVCVSFIKVLQIYFYIKILYKGVLFKEKYISILRNLRNSNLSLIALFTFISLLYELLCRVDLSVLLPSSQLYSCDFFQKFDYFVMACWSSDVLNDSTFFFLSIIFRKQVISSSWKFGLNIFVLIGRKNLEFTP